MAHIIPAEFFVDEIRLPITAFKSEPFGDRLGFHLVREEIDWETSLDQMIPDQGTIIMRLKRGQAVESWRIQYDKRFHVPWCALCQYNLVDIDQAPPTLKDETITLLVEGIRRID